MRLKNNDEVDLERRKLLIHIKHKRHITSISGIGNYINLEIKPAKVRERPERPQFFNRKPSKVYPPPNKPRPTNKLSQCNKSSLTPHQIQFSGKAMQQNVGETANKVYVDHARYMKRFRAQLNKLPMARGLLSNKSNYKEGKELNKTQGLKELFIGIKKEPNTSCVSTKSKVDEKATANIFCSEIKRTAIVPMKIASMSIVNKSTEYYGGCISTANSKNKSFSLNIKPDKPSRRQKSEDQAEKIVKCKPETALRLSPPFTKGKMLLHPRNSSNSKNGNKLDKNLLKETDYDLTLIEPSKIEKVEDTALWPKCEFKIEVQRKPLARGNLDKVDNDDEFSSEYSELLSRYHL